MAAIVPNYNYAEYLSERLTTVFAQTYPIYEIIVIDDCSTDDSVEVIQRAAASAGRDITIRVNRENTGNVFQQWKSALHLTDAEYVWFAEADDRADSKFLERMIVQLTTTDDSLFAFCDSVTIASDGKRLFDGYKNFSVHLGEDGLNRDGSFDGLDFLRRFLAVRNRVLNASAVLWRADVLRRVFVNTPRELFALAGDWRAYIAACLQGGTVHYVADTLNEHRRHGRSVTARLDKQIHLDEIHRIHEIVTGHFPNDSSLVAEMRRDREKLAADWGLPREADPELARLIR